MAHVVNAALPSGKDTPLTAKENMMCYLILGSDSFEDHKAQYSCKISAILCKWIDNDIHMTQGHKVTEF